MNWLIFSLLNALFESFSNVLGKRGAQKIDVLSAVWASRFFGLFILIPLVLFSDSLKDLNQTFWTVAIIGAFLNTITSILFVKAIKDSPLSLTAPLTAFTPVFLLITSPLIVNEFPSFLGVMGVFSVFIGSYILNLSQRKKGIFEPIFAILKEPGSRLVLTVAFIWSITSNLDKIGVVNSDPLTFAVVMNALVLTFLTIVLFTRRVSFVNVFKNAHILAPIGIVAGISTVFQMTAISMTLVSNVISVKRTSALFSIVWGRAFFKEENINERFVGAAIMVLGVALIVFG